MSDIDPSTGIPIDPINPVTVNQLTIDQLTNLLEQQRDARLSYVKKLDALAKVKVAAHLVDVQVKFERQVERVKTMLAKFDALEGQVREGINKLRVLQLEFGEDE